METPCTRDHKGLNRATSGTFMPRFGGSLQPQLSSMAERARLGHPLVWKRFYPQAPTLGIQIAQSRFCFVYVMPQSMHDLRTWIPKQRPQRFFWQGFRIWALRLGLWFGGPGSPAKSLVRVLLYPRGSKYRIFKDPGPRNHTLNGFWDQSP